MLGAMLRIPVGSAGRLLEQLDYALKALGIHAW
jgi:hypothetical protein